MSSICAPLSFVSRASSRIAVFLPSKPPASSVQRSAVSSASVCIRSRSAINSSSSLLRARVITFAVALFAAIASPVTSPSLLSRFVKSAMHPPLGSLLRVRGTYHGRRDANRRSEDLGAPGQRPPPEDRVRSFDRSLRHFLETESGAELLERHGAKVGRAQDRHVERDLRLGVDARRPVLRGNAPAPLVPRANGVAYVEDDRPGAG